jgi:TatA/E family protein of Tat protein translocase
MNIGPTELIVILVIALIFFGPRKLPDLGKSLGHAMAQFRRASDDFKRSWEQEVESERTRMSEITQQIESPVSSYDPYSTVSDHTEPEGSYSESSQSENADPAVEPAAGPVPEPATVARGTENRPSEHWI